MGDGFPILALVEKLSNGVHILIRKDVCISLENEFKLLEIQSVANDGKSEYI